MSKLTLDEAIKHCLEVAEENDLAAGTYELLAENNHNAYERLAVETNSSRCAECAADHRQLAEWLTDYKELRNSVGAVKLELLKEAQAELEKRGNMLHDAIAELEKAKRLLKAAVEDANSEAESLCAFCKHNDLVDGCPYIENYSECEYVWRYTDEALKLIES